MKRFATWTILLSMVALSAFSQKQAAEVSGRILESDTQLPAIAASVQLLNLPDSTQSTGMASNSQGLFRLQAKPGKYVLKVTYIGYMPQLIPVQLTSTPKRMGDIMLQPDAILLAEAVVVAEAPQVQVVEDTVQFNASAYRTPQGATLEELVKKLPGAEVDDDGNVKINGKDVSKILVNGKEFFGGDVATGLQNLPVEMIEKLKTYDKKSDLARITGIDDGEEETVLDLTVKKEMNTGWFGNADLAGGTEDRYSARGMINYFRGNTQVTLIGRANNVNDQGFSGGGGGPRWRRNSGLTARKDIGLNFATESEKLALEGSARYNYRDNDQISTGYTENFLTGQNSSSFSNSNSTQNNRNVSVWANFKMEWRPDTLTNIIFRPNFSYSQTQTGSFSQSGTFNEDPYTYVPNPNDYLDLDALAQADILSEEDPLKDIRVNTSNNQSSRDGNSLSANATLQVNRKLNSKGRNITFRGRFEYGDDDSDQYSSSDTRYFLTGSTQNDDIIRRYITSPSNDYSYQAQVTYSEPIAKATFLQFSYRFQYSLSESDKNTYDLSTLGWDMGAPLPDDYLDHRDDDQSKYAKYQTYAHDARIGLRFVRPKYQLNAGLSFQPQNTRLTYQKGDIDTISTRHVFNFAPNVDLRVRFSKLSQLRVTYRGRSSQPSMENLLPVTDDSNPLSIQVGNPDLKPAFSHNLRLFYNNYIQEKQRGIFAHANFQLTQNSISSSRVYNESTGGWTTTPRNINGNWSAFGMFGINTALKNKKFTIGSFTNARYANNVGYLTSGRGADAIEQKNTTTNLTLNERLNATFRNDWLEFGVNGTLSYSIEKDKLTPSNNQQPYTFSYGANTTVNLPWNMSISTNLTNQSRRGYSDSSMNRNELIWNAQIAQTFLKGDATVSLEFYDILQQQSNITRSLTASGRSVYEYNGINSYCMVHFIYRLNIFGGKRSNKRPEMRGPRGFGPRFGPHRRF
ncbi:MAG TPA: outer membrane beta-barrel protein [Candidatus Bacteroides merdigallinarum]|uniref:Outer membrane beta-barrel protein n=1 Tax=Candidatus Bacteroides merdigallinarum TaxID=2838473 RepID=A0A9D2E7H2_9BACE|nr:outer membrane beta-barrel protein [Candidatus Bacteroides merdigallinarum]